MFRFKAERILIANPYGIGDVLFTTPLISTLKKHFPSSYIAFLVGSRTKEVLSANPDIDEIFVFDRDASRQKNKIEAYREVFKLMNTLRRKNFDLFFDFSNTSQYGFLSFVLGIKWRLGFNYKNRGRFLNHKMPLDGFEKKHVIEYYLSLLDFLPVKIEKDRKTKFYLSKEAEEWADKFFNDNGLNGNMVIGIHPGGGASWAKMARFKWWDKERFITLAKTLINEYQLKILLFSEPEREEEIMINKKELNDKNFIFPVNLSLTQFAALIKRCRLLISNEGGPFQIAVALETPTVSIYGPVSEIVYGPYPPAEIHQVVTKGLDCQPCYRSFCFKPCSHRRCLDELTGAEVLAKVKKVMDNKPKG